MKELKTTNHLKKPEVHENRKNGQVQEPLIIRMIKSKRTRWAGHVAQMGENRNANTILVEKPECKIPLGRPRRRWDNNIRMDLGEIGRDGVDWVDLAQDRDQWRALVNTLMNLRVP
jgi:hypothetical protein